VIAPRTLVGARKPIGYVVHAVIEITTNARINTTTMLTAVNNLVFNSFY
jgi:hypothetical protein